MSDHEIVFGTPEHIAGLSREALEEDFRWVNDRRMELEGECERLASENAKLRELVRDYDKELEGSLDVWGIMAEVTGHWNKYDALHKRAQELGAMQQ